MYYWTILLRKVPVPVRAAAVSNRLLQNKSTGEQPTFTIRKKNLIHVKEIVSVN